MTAGELIPLPEGFDIRQMQTDERAISLRAAADLADFYRGQLDVIPEWHALHHEWRVQLSVLERRLVREPKELTPEPIRGSDR